MAGVPLISMLMKTAATAPALATIESVCNSGKSVFKFNEYR